MTNKLQVVQDTGVLVSALLVPKSVPRAALEFASGFGTLLTSIETYEELDQVLRRKKFEKYVPELDRERYLAEIAVTSQWVSVAITLHECRDPKDDKILEFAVAGNATHIVSSDIHLLELSPFQGIPILTRRAFLDATRLP